MGHDADDGVEGSHQLVSVLQEEDPLDVSWVKARRPGCRVRRKGKEGVLNQGERGNCGEVDWFDREERVTVSRHLVDRRSREPVVR